MVLAIGSVMYYLPVIEVALITLEDVAVGLGVGMFSSSVFRL